MKAMHIWVFLGLFLLAAGAVGCKSDCVTCTGPTAPRKYCPDDYQYKSDFEKDVSAYEDAGGQCE